MPHCISILFVHSHRCDALRAERVENFAGQVVLVGCVHDAEVSGLCVPHRETRMVFGGEDDVLDAGQRRQRGPIFWLELARIESLRQLFKEPLCVGFVSADERMRNHDAGYRAALVRGRRREGKKQ
jgi:hypothetical protein